MSGCSPEACGAAAGETAVSSSTPAARHSSERLECPRLTPGDGGPAAMARQRNGQPVTALGVARIGQGRPYLAALPLLTVGIDIGGTKVAAGVVDADGLVLERLRADTPSKTKSPHEV